MLQSVKYIGHLDRDNGPNTYRYEYVVTDDKLGDTLVITHTTTFANSVCSTLAVIEAYENLRLPVAKAIVTHLRKEFPDTESFVGAIDRNIKHNPKYLPYAKEIEKYLVLI